MTRRLPRPFNFCDGIKIVTLGDMLASAVIGIVIVGFVILATLCDWRE